MVQGHRPLGTRLKEFAAKGLLEDNPFSTQDREILQPFFIPRSKKMHFALGHDE
jgi:hypothetical protein